MSDDSDNSPQNRASDVPMDLRKERDSFVRTFLRRGVELTEELLHENDDLRAELERQRNENLRLRAQVASDDAFRDFMKKIEALEAEKRRLLDKANELEEVSNDDATRAAAVESELNDMANLYIAAYQLHASLSVRRVLRHVQDVLGQLMGAYAFAIYIVEPDGKTAGLIAQENLDPDELPPIVVGEGPVGLALLTGVAKIPDEIKPGTIEQPFAIMPMMVGDRAVGVVSIVTMLEQKSRWATVDSELQKLVGEHAGNAFIAANLFSASDGAVAALSDLPANLKKRSHSMLPVAVERE